MLKIWEFFLNLIMKIIDHPTLWSVIFLVCTILIGFKKYLIEFGLLEFYNNSTWLIVLGFITSIVIFIIKISKLIYVFCNRLLDIRKKENMRIKYENSILQELNSLNQSEMELLVWAVSNNTNSIPGSPQVYQTFYSLTQKGILRSGIVSIQLPMMIENFVWEVIRNDPRFQRERPTNYPEGY